MDRMTIGVKEEEKKFLLGQSLKSWRTGGDILGDGHQVTVHGIHLDTQEPCRWPQESIFDATSEPRRRLIRVL